MNFKRWASLLAIISVLLHAGALVRHNAMLLMGSPAFAGEQIGSTYEVRADDGSVLISGPICNPSSYTSDGAGQPAGGKSTGNQCPVCSGAAFASALEAPEPASVSLPTLSCEVIVPEHSAVATAVRLGVPSNRGPPAAA